MTPAIARARRDAIRHMLMAGIHRPEIRCSTHAGIRLLGRIKGRAVVEVRK